MNEALRLAALLGYTGYRQLCAAIEVRMLENLFPPPTPTAIEQPVKLGPRHIARRPLRARLIFNPGSGRPEESAQQLADILAAMHHEQIFPDVYEVGPHSRVGAVVQNSIKRGIRLVVVAGGDGTIDSVAGAMVGSPAVFGVIPIGTRNNVALSLGVPKNIPEAVAILRAGRRMRIDVGQVRSGRAGTWFLEAAAMGLVSDLYPLADDIQHGQLALIGDLLSTLVGATPSRLRISLDGREQPATNAHMALVANMPYLGPNFQVAPDVAFNDGRLDVFIFSEMSKLDLVGYVLQVNRGGATDTRVQHHRVKQVTIDA
ncbi:MAG: diacylglycerol kinase family protein, partial [Anaerolineales bacterium]